MIDGEAATPASAARRFDPLDAAIGVITRPVAAMQQIAAARAWLVGLGLAIAIALLNGLADLVGPPQDLDPAGADLPSGFVGYLDSAQSPGGVLVSAVVLTPLVLVVVSYVFHLAGWLLGGRGPFSALLATQGFTSVPLVLLAPVTVVLNLAGVPLLGGLLGLAVALWGMILAVIGIRESLALSTGRAMATVLIPFGLLILLSCVVGVVVAALVAGG